MISIYFCHSSKVVKYVYFIFFNLAGCFVFIFRSSSLVIADFGCGDCKIARSVKNKVHCFDLAPICDLVTACDMANVSCFFFYFFIRLLLHIRLSDADYSSAGAVGGSCGGGKNHY